MIRKIVLLSSMLFLNSVAAETIDVDYSRFYSHVKKLDNEDTQALQFAFGFLRVGEGRLCAIESADIVTDKKTMALSITDEGRFTVPLERALKLADAYVKISLEERANVCDMSVQLETQPSYLKASYTNEDLQFLYEQYEAFFNEMGSFLSFMMPSVTGLMIQFEDKDLDYRTKEGLSIVKGVLRIEESWLKKGETLTLPHAPLRITAIASS
ncbi:DUF2987 domain-containing protein [Alteromonas sp.]|nr:DUF2987 domain-containing protein [Alteromonas sp.]